MPRFTRPGPMWRADSSKGGPRSSAPTSTHSNSDPLAPLSHSPQRTQRRRWVGGSVWAGGGSNSRHELYMPPWFAENMENLARKWVRHSISWYKRQLLSNICQFSSDRRGHLVTDLLKAVRVSERQDGKGRLLPIRNVFYSTCLSHTRWKVVRRNWWCGMATVMLAKIHKPFYQFLTFLFLKQPGSDEHEKKIYLLNLRSTKHQPNSLLVNALISRSTDCVWVPAFYRVTAAGRSRLATQDSLTQHCHLWLIIYSTLITSWHGYSPS